MFKKRYTQWIPLGCYSHGYAQYIVFVRKNLKTSMMQFKTKCANPSMYKDAYLPSGLIDVKEAWKRITE